MAALSSLDRFLDAALYAFSLDDTGASKSKHDRAHELLIDQERTFITGLGLNTENQADSDAFDRLLELVDAYRADESQYEALVSYVEAIRKK